MSNYLLVDDDRFIYDAESNTYGSSSVHATTDIRLLSLGDPSVFNSNYIIYDGLNDTDVEHSHYLEEADEHKRQIDRKKKKNKGKAKKSKKVKLPNDELLNELYKEEGDSAERHPRAARVSRTNSQPGNSRRKNYRTRYYTVTRGRNTPHRQQYRITITNHEQPNSNRGASPPPRRALDTSASRSRGRNEIIPQKPKKPTSQQGSPDDQYPFKKFGYKNPKNPVETPAVPRHPEDRRRKRKKQYFVLRVSHLSLITVCQHDFMEQVNFWHEHKKDTEEKTMTHGP